jgi:integrase
MTTNHHIDSRPQAEASADDALATLAASMGIDVAELAKRIGTPAVDAPTVAEHVSTYLARSTPTTRDTYSTHLLRMVRDVGPVCDQTCEPCLQRELPRQHVDGSMVEDYVCRCDCKPCVSSRITIPALGGRIVGTDVYTLELTRDLAAVARRYAVKSGVVDNRGRARRGLPAKRADGHNAEESAIAALRSLFTSGAAYLGAANPAKAVRKPRRDPKERRPMQPFELAELHLVTVTGGNDPELDGLALDTGIATSARSEGIELLSVGQLHRPTQMIHVRDKGKRLVPMPVSADLIDALLQHAISRGGPQCDPTSPDYRPDSRVFRQKNGAPISGRRIDRLAERWQRSLPWALEEGVTFHYIRHTIAAYLAQVGPQYKKRYLRHADNTVTDIYGKCPIDDFAGVMATLLGFEHPLVHGMDDRRAEALRRMGLTDERQG